MGFPAWVDLTGVLGGLRGRGSLDLGAHLAARGREISPRGALTVRTLREPHDLQGAFPSALAQPRVTRLPCGARERRPPFHVGVVLRNRRGFVQLAPALPEPFALRTQSGPAEHLAPGPAGQLDNCSRISLQVQPPGRDQPSGSATRTARPHLSRSWPSRPGWSRPCSIR